MPLEDPDEPKTAVPAGFFDDKSEERRKMSEIGFQKPKTPAPKTETPSSGIAYFSRKKSKSNTL